MDIHTKRIAIFIAAILVFLPAKTGVADTWRLDKSGQLTTVDSNDKFALAVANIKRLGQEGKTKELKQALKDLKGVLPQIADSEYKSFTEAELLFCKGKFEKAFLSYEKFLNRFPESPLYPVALDREFAIGTAYLQGRKKKVLGIFRLSGLEEGAKVMEKIADRAGDSPIAVKALVAVAETYEKKRMYEEAYQQWSLISGRWPTGAIAKDSLLAMARCQHADYKGPFYDSSSLISAKGYYERFKLIYPEDAKTLNIDERLKLIDEQIAYKKFTIGKYYQRTEDKNLEPQVRASSLYYDMVVKNWPDTAAAKMAKTAAGEKNTKNNREAK
jgi:tetratricopeptide (TPR) repeat protein